MTCRRVVLNARSSYFKVVPSRFLPPPIPVAQTTEGLKAPDKHEDSCSYKFPSMFVSQILKPDDILPTAKNCFKIPPYDLYCTSVESCLTDRVCKVCNMYFASKVMLTKHLGVHAAIRADAVQTMAAAAAPQRIRPLRVSARRQRELMVVIAQRELNSEKSRNTQNGSTKTLLT